MGDLWEAVVESGNLWHAWEGVRRRSPMAGVDGLSVREFGKCAPSHLSTLRRALQRGRYQPQSLLGVFIPKAAGGWRRVGVPTVRDRVAQRACLNVLLPLLDPHLEECSYAYRPGRSIEDALAQLERWRDKGHEHLLESDIENCFDSIDHDLLGLILRRYIADARLLELIGQWMECSTVWEPRHDRQLPHPDYALPPAISRVRSCGIPQGSVLSPLLCNLFLDAFDEALLRRRFKLVRYADDFVIVATRRERAEDSLQAAQLALENQGLRLNLGKTRLTTFEKGFRYLGTLFQGDLMLPTHRRAGANGNVTFVPGYSQAPRLPPNQHPKPPAAPVAPTGAAPKWDTCYLV